MGCTSSKQAKANVVADVYKPPPSSFAVFDVNAIQEPWLKFEHEDDEKPPRSTVFDRLDEDDDDDDDDGDDAPKTWEEVSKSLETKLKPAAVKPPEVDSVKPPATPPRRLPRKSASFHTLDELEVRAKRSIAAQIPTTVVKLKRTESMSKLRPESDDRTESTQSSYSGPRSVKENIFVKRDRERREKEGNKKPVMNWDPLREFPEKCPPGGGEGLIVYTTSLQGVRRTYEDCMRVRAIMEQQGVVVDERDVSLDAGVLSELKELLQDEASVAPPRVFVKGRYLGGAAEVTAMNENGKLGRVLRWARVERVGEEGRLTCEGCGGARWLPCFECGGSCKVAAVGAAKGERWERCVKCNENGLIRCPVCFVN